MANFLQKQNNLFEEVLLTNELTLISNSAFINDVINKVSLNKLFSYKLRKLKIEDSVTVEVFKTVGTKITINNSLIYYIGELNKLFELKED